MARMTNHVFSPWSPPIDGQSHWPQLLASLEIFLMMSMQPIPDIASPVFEIKTQKQQRAYFHPVRMKILGFLTHGRLTVSQTAERLKVHPANITHHFRVLQDARLIRLVEERDIGRVIERYYEAVAPVFDVRPPEGSVNHVNQKAMSFLRNDLAANINRLNFDDSEDVIALIETAHIDAKTFLSFAKRLRALIEEFERLDCNGGVTHALNVSLYPHKIDLDYPDISSQERLPRSSGGVWALFAQRRGRGARHFCRGRNAD